MNRFFKTLLVLVTISLVTTSCRDVMKMKSSVRRTQSEFNFINRGFKSVSKGLGINNKDKDKEEEVDSTKYLTLQQKNMLNDYGYIFDMLNPKEDRIRSNNFTWDSVQKVYYVKTQDYKTIKPENEVFGWHPYWMGSKWEQYPFELLSTIAYFSYKIDADTGSYTNPAQIEDWRTTRMIDSAKAKSTRVLLTVSCHGYENNSKFLDHPDRWDVLIDTLSELVLSRDADGVDLNFELLPYFKREKFNRFVKYFRNRLDDDFSNANKKFYLSITLPANNSRDIFDVRELQNHADLLVIMGYDYHIGDKAQGAVSPLRSSENSSLSLSTTVEYYLESGIDPSKTILALPYYGSLWKGELSKDGSTVYNTSTYDKPLTYSEIRKKYIDNDKLKVNAFRDEVSMTNYYNLTFADNSTQEIWFDDDYTLRKKYDYALSNKLRGIGIWALGYDNGYDDLWNVIEDKFSTDQKIIKNPILESQGYPVRFSKYLLQYKSIFITAAVFFLMTVVLAFFVLLCDWNVRDSIVRNQLHLLIFAVVVFILLIPITVLLYTTLNDILPWANVFIKSEWKYFLSYFVGLMTLFVAYRIKIKPIKRP